MSEPKAPSEFTTWWRDQGCVQSIAQGSTKANALAAWLAAIAAAEKVLFDMGESDDMSAHGRGYVEGVSYCADAIAALREGK